jgi:putative lipoic acid-binding regulatory protein
MEYRRFQLFYKKPKWTAFMEKIDNQNSNETHKELPQFPTEITFKAIFQNTPLLEEIFKNLFAENNLFPSISSKQSSHSKYISYTFTSVFQSEEQLYKVCRKIASVQGFTTMF